MSRVRSASPGFHPIQRRDGSGAENNGSCARTGGASRISSSTRPVSLARIIPNIVEDQQRIWLFPKSVFQDQTWKPVTLFLVILGGLILVDPYDPGFFRHTHFFYGFNTVVSGWNAAAGMWVVTIAILGIGLLRGDRYMRNTAFYIFEAVVDSEILTQALKGIDRRVRPQDVSAYNHFLDSWFRDKGHWYSGPGSFPSGHMIAAMSIATVFALRYSNHRWVPWTAYGLAVVVGCSRITLLSHFPSDVFAGGVFGYAISRYVVLGEARLKAARDAETGQEQEIPRVEALS